jgi:hypothetical protein
MGQAVGEGFRLPWNVTRSLADVWAEEQQRLRSVSRKQRFERDRLIRAGLRREADLAAGLEVVATNG